MIDEILLKNCSQLYAFFIFDIDNFKQANDKYGHAFDDGCIKKFTDTIKLHFNQDTILDRLEGDKFAAFITVENIDNLINKANKLSQALNIIYDDNINQWHMSASIGIAVAPSDGNDFDTLYRNGDKALYQTKQRNKNGFTIYNPDNLT